MVQVPNKLAAHLVVGPTALYLFGKLGEVTEYSGPEKAVVSPQMSSLTSLTQEGNPYINST